MRKPAVKTASVSAAPPPRPFAGRIYAAVFKNQGTTHKLGALFAGTIIMALVLFALQPQPLQLSNGKLFAVDAHGSPLQRSELLPGDHVHIQWDLTWLALCKIEVSPHFIGADRQVRDEKVLVINPQKKVGFYPAQFREIALSTLPPGKGIYFSILRPKCWFDLGPLAREYRSDDVPYEIGKWTEQLQQKK